jgi:hypothetical protein
MGQEANTMANLNIELPDDLALSLEGIAAAQRMTVQQLALERLTSLVEEVIPGSPAALLRALQSPPYPNLADVEELNAAIAASRVPIRARDLFSE